MLEQNKRIWIPVMLAALALGGCKTDFQTRNGNGRGTRNNLYGQVGANFGNSSYNSNVGVYLVYNTTSRTSSAPQPANTTNNTGLGVVGVVNGDDGMQPNEYPGAGGIVGVRGNTYQGSGKAPCVLRRFEAYQEGNNFNGRQYNNAGVARKIWQGDCDRSSRVSVSARGAYIDKTGPNGNIVTYVPLSITGGTLGTKTLSFNGTVGKIDAGDTDYVVATISRNGTGTYDTLAIMREKYVDNLGIVVPSIEYEVSLPNHEINDIVVDRSHNTLFIATTFARGWGKIIAYSLNDGEAFSQDHMSSVISRTQAVLPGNTMMRNPYQVSSYGWDDGEGNSVFVTTVPAMSIKNFDGLTGAMTADGRIFAIQDLYGKNVEEADRTALEEQWGTTIEDFDYLGTRSGFIWGSGQNTRNPYTFPNQLPQKYTTLDVADNIFMALAEGTVYYFLADDYLTLQSGVPRHRNFLMGHLNTIEIDNQSNIAVITSDKHVKICHISGSLSCGPQSTADFSEDMGTILTGVMMPKTISTEATAQDITNLEDSGDNG